MPKDEPTVIVYPATGLRRKLRATIARRMSLTPSELSHDVALTIETVLDLITARQVTLKDVEDVTYYVSLRPLDVSDDEDMAGVYDSADRLARASGVRHAQG